MKYLYIITGCFFLALGAVGAVLPILPTTPFLLITAFCFAKGSVRFHNWFVKTKLYHKYLEDYVRERGMTLRVKLIILFYASSIMILAFCLMHNLYGRIAILAVMAFKYYYFFFRIKTLKPALKTEQKEDLV